MTLFITRYFLKELSPWIFFTPISLIIFLFIGSFTGIPFSFTLMTLMIASIIVFSKYHETRKIYEKMFALFPIDRRIMLHVDIAFHGWISACYILYTLGGSSILRSLVERQWMFPSGNDLLFIMCSSLLLITLSLLLIWWDLPPNILIYVLFFTPVLPVWNVSHLVNPERSLTFLFGTVGLFIVVYFVIRNHQKWRDIA